MAGGLAGGSADAAAALVACSQLWDLDVSAEQLRRVAALLGSDVPFALLGGTALGSGRGEDVMPALARGTFHWVLGFGHQGLSTPAVYRRFDELHPRPPAPVVPVELMEALRAGDPIALGAALVNDLQRPALDLQPRLGRTVGAGLELGAVGAIVSGSGPTVAFLAADEAGAVDLAVALSTEGCLSRDTTSQRASAGRALTLIPLTSAPSMVEIARLRPGIRIGGALVSARVVIIRLTRVSSASPVKFVHALSPRDPHEAHRVSTPLELLTDLCFVVAVAQASAGLHHAIAENHIGHGLIGFGIAFFAIWWTWLNFSWFASAYDNDDVVYRLLTILQIIGVLVLAAGVAGFFTGDFLLPILGYVIMRIALVIQWLRASRGDPRTRRTCRRYAFGLVVVQLLWVSLLAVPHDYQLLLFPLLALLDFGVPRVGGANRRDAVASRAHRRPVRRVLHHRARRIDPGCHGRDPGSLDRPRPCGSTRWW